MSATRLLAVVTGVLFIVATAANLVAAAILPPLGGADYLAGIVTGADRVAIAAVFYIVAAFASAGIAVAMYPVMRRSNAGLALGSVVFRALEAAFYLLGVVSLLSLVRVGTRAASAGTVERAPLVVVGDALVGLHDHASLLAVFAFCLGAFLYYTLFFQGRQIPRWLSGWGILAILLMLVASVLALSADKQITSYVALAIPIGVQELVLAVWLLAKGFWLPTTAGPSEGSRRTSEGGAGPRGAAPVPRVPAS